MILEVREGQPFKLLHPGDEAVLSRHLGGLVQQVGSDWVVSRVVGHLRLAQDRVLRIRSPKATTSSLLSWIAYVDPQMRSLHHICHLPDADRDGDLSGALAWLFCQQLQQVVQRQGLLRRYQQQSQTTGVVRGRIEFAQLTRRVGPLDKLPCLIPERIYNTKLNQLLAAAFEVIRRDPCLRGAAGKGFDQCATILQPVKPAVDPALLSGRTGLNRLEVDFEPLLALGRLLLTGNALGEGAGVDGVGFIVNLEQLFERTITRAFQEAGIPHREQAPIRYGRGQHQHGGQFNADLILLTNPPIIVDAKFKSSVSSSNLQQMVTYCVMTGARQAVLVLPAGHIADRRVYRFALASGFDEVRVNIVELDTSGESLGAWRLNAQAMVAATNFVADPLKLGEAC